MKIEDMISANRADCSGCSACANVCPKNAITMKRDAEGFLYPKIDPELCIQCGRCDATCPALNFTKKSPDKFPSTFVATYSDNKILQHSSSGGIFSALSELVLREGGVVFGAAFDENWRVYHTAARSFDELEKLRGSKYVQSKIGDVYRQVKDLLPTTKVLFSGTSCQCAGLKHFLGGDHENLLTVEIICHGVPSPTVWERYIDRLGHQYDIAHVNFRSKRISWSDFCIEITFFNRGRHSIPIAKHLYGKLFLENMILRPSCHACKFRYPNGQSDLTLGDAWGVKSFAPEMYDSRGTSVIFVHTNKGADFFKRMNLHSKQVNFFAAVNSNIPFMTPLLADTRRENFFADFAAASDKFAVLEKYYYQDDAELRKENSRLNRVAFRTAYRNVAASVRKNFTENILVASPLDDDAKNFLTEHFAQTNPNAALYFLRINDKGELVCKEEFSTLDFPIKMEVAALKDFAKKFNITQVVTDDPQNLDVPVVAEWIDVCGLPVQILEQSSK